MTIVRRITGKSSDFSPMYGNQSDGGGDLLIDPSGNVVTRATVLTDEGGFRANFSGNNIYISVGTITCTNGSNVITGTLFDTFSFSKGDYIKLSTDADAFYTQISSIDSPTQITLEIPYTNTGTATGFVSVVDPIIGTGGSYNVTNGVCSLLSGTTVDSISEFVRNVDVLPLTKQCGVSVTQRILNQDIYIGLYDPVHVTTPWYFAWFRLSGTDKTRVLCESAYSREAPPSRAEVESILVTLPSGMSTDISIRYRIEVLQDRCRFLINDSVVATAFKTSPTPNSFLTSTIRVVNGSTAPAASTAIIVDYDSVMNFNSVVIKPINDTDAAPATTNDMETLIDLVNTLISKTPGPILPVVGTGGGGVGIPRVTISSDSSLAANQSTNVAQFGGTNIAIGAGASTFGVPRVTLSTDSFASGPQLSLGTTLPIIYNAIIVS